MSQGQEATERQYLTDLAEERMETIEKLKGSNRRAVAVLRRKLFKNDGSWDISALGKQNQRLPEVGGTSFPKTGFSYHHLQECIS